MADRLTTLAMKYGTDKCPPYESYTPYYSKLFKGMEVKSLLEIGIGYPGTMEHIPNYKIGASLRMWRDYFPKAMIWGADIRLETLIVDDRIGTILCDQSSKESLLQMIKALGKQDVIIDDGSHQTAHQISSAQVLLPYTKLYIIEDVKEPDKIKTKFPDCIVKSFLKTNDFDDRLVIIWSQSA
jgi:hypothetical protein